MTDLIDEIIKLTAEFPAPVISRIVVISHGVPPSAPVSWPKRGILWMHAQTMDRLMADVTHGEQPESMVVTSLFGLRIEAYTPHVHGKLWLEFLEDQHHA